MAQKCRFRRRAVVPPWRKCSMVGKRHFLRHLYIQCIILPRQARDRHRESTQKKSGVSLGDVIPSGRSPLTWYLLRVTLMYKPKDLHQDWSPRFPTLRDKNGWIRAKPAGNLNIGVSRSRFCDFLADPDSRSFSRFYTTN
jgi:hypothetical protein